MRVWAAASSWRTTGSSNRPVRRARATAGPMSAIASLAPIMARSLASVCTAARHP